QNRLFKILHSLLLPFVFRSDSPKEKIWLRVGRIIADDAFELLDRALAILPPEIDLGELGADVVADQRHIRQPLEQFKVELRGLGVIAQRIKVFSQLQTQRRGGGAELLCATQDRQGLGPGGFSLRGKL